MSSLRSNVGRILSLNCENKLRLVDSHVRRHQKLPESCFMNPQLLQFYRRQAECQSNEPSTSLKLGEEYSINFVDFTSKALSIQTQLSVPSNRVAYLRIHSTNNTSKVQVTVDDRRTRKYSISGVKAILVKQQDWRKIHITIRVDRKGKLSMVKLETGTMKSEFRSKSAVTVVRKDEVKKEIQAFIVQNKCRVDQIKESRKLRSANMTSRNFLMRGCLSQTRFTSPAVRLASSQSSRTIWTATAVKNRRNFIALETEKAKILRHIKRMDPQKSVGFKQHEQHFKIAQKSQQIKLSTLLFLATFMGQCHAKSIKHYECKIRKIKIDMISEKFMSSLKQANKGKNSVHMKCKLTISQFVPLSGKILYKDAIMKSEKVVYEQLQPIFRYSEWEQISKKTTLYHESLRFIQGWWRRKRVQLLKRKQLQENRRQEEAEKAQSVRKVVDMGHQQEEPASGSEANSGGEQG